MFGQWQVAEVAREKTDTGTGGTCSPDTEGPQAIQTDAHTAVWCYWTSTIRCKLRDAILVRNPFTSCTSPPVQKETLFLWICGTSLSGTTPTFWDSTYKRAAQINILLSLVSFKKIHVTCLLKPHQLESQSYNMLIWAKTSDYFNNFYWYDPSWLEKYYFWWF